MRDFGCQRNFLDKPDPIVNQLNEVKVQDSLDRNGTIPKSLTDRDEGHERESAIIGYLRYFQSLICARVIPEECQTWRLKTTNFNLSDQAWLLKTKNFVKIRFSQEGTDKKEEIQDENKMFDILDREDGITTVESTTNINAWTEIYNDMTKYEPLMPTRLSPHVILNPAMKQSESIFKTMIQQTRTVTIENINYKARHETTKESYSQTHNPTISAVCERNTSIDHSNIIQEKSRVHDAPGKLEKTCEKTSVFWERHSSICERQSNMGERKSSICEERSSICEIKTNVPPVLTNYTASNASIEELKHNDPHTEMKHANFPISKASMRNARSKDSRKCENLKCQKSNLKRIESFSEKHNDEQLKKYLKYQELNCRFEEDCQHGSNERHSRKPKKHLNHLGGNVLCLVHHAKHQAQEIFSSKVKHEVKSTAKQMNIDYCKDKKTSSKRQSKFKYHIESRPPTKAKARKFKTKEEKQGKDRMTKYMMDEHTKENDTPVEDLKRLGHNKKNGAEDTSVNRLKRKLLRKQDELETLRKLIEKEAKGVCNEMKKLQPPGKETTREQKLWEVRSNIGCHGDKCRKEELEPDENMKKNYSTDSYQDLVKKYSLLTEECKVFRGIYKELQDQKPKITDRIKKKAKTPESLPVTIFYVTKKVCPLETSEKIKDTRSKCKTEDESIQKMKVHEAGDMKLNEHIEEVDVKEN